MRRCVFVFAVAAGLVSSSLACAAPWSFDPERHLASLTDEDRCAVGSLKPEMTGSTAPRQQVAKSRKHFPAYIRRSQ